MAEQNPDLLKQAAELNIQVTETATDEAIQAAIDEVLAEDASKTPEPAKKTRKQSFGGKGDHDGNGKAGGAAPALIAVQVRRDFWDQTGTRHRKGTVVEVSVDAALDGVEVGALSRVR